jgi:DNA modification methylase
MNTVRDQAQGRDWTLWLGDSADVLPALPPRSVDLAVFSPPFGNVYAYSPSERDLGNVRDDCEFWDHFGFVTPSLMRAMKPGRIVAVHVANLPTYESREGVTGLKDFRGETIRHFQAAGFVYHAEVTIDKNPQMQAIRHHPKGLLFVQLDRDASWMRMALADYVVVFRTPGANEIPIKTDLSRQDWIAFAAPVWTGLRETDVLPVLAAREEEDERHLCPLQLSVIERCVRLWSNRGETVLDPFAGVGSTGYVALRQGRRFCGVELKASYYRVAKGNLERGEMSRALPLFADALDSPRARLLG